MSSIVPVRLPDPIFTQLEQEAQASGLSRSQIIRMALSEHYRSQALQDLRSVTAQMRDHMSGQGFTSEDEIAQALEA